MHYCAYRSIWSSFLRVQELLVCSFPEKRRQEARVGKAGSRAVGNCGKKCSGYLVLRSTMR